MMGEIAISIDKVSSLSTSELSMTNEIDVDKLGIGFPRSCTFIVGNSFCIKSSSGSNGKNLKQTFVYSEVSPSA